MTARTIRTLSAADVETLVGWAADEGWNPGLDDASAFPSADPEGFIGAFLGEEMVAGISAVTYGDDFGFVGLYISRRDQRGQGHGRAVWDAGMARLAGRTIGLDGVADQQANYASMGFAPNYRTVRYSGRPDLSASLGDGVRPVTPNLVLSVVAYDRQCFPGPRQAFLEKWLRPPRIAFAIENCGAIAGYGVLRQCREGCKIGPLFADSPDLASSLLAALADSAGSSGLHIDVPETNGGFAELLMSSGLKPGFETMRMYKGQAPLIMQERVFAITTLELG